MAFEGELTAKDRRTIRLDAASLASGLYVVRVEGETFTATTRAVRVQ